MDYEYDIFISFKAGDIDYWLNEIFMKRFRFDVENALGREPKIYIYSEAKTGASWKLEILNALARSRSLVAFLQPSYFQSEWCIREFQFMYNREQQEGFRTVTNPDGLIVTVWVGDGVHFPDYVGDIRSFDSRNYFSNSKAFVDSPIYLEFEEKLKNWSLDVAAAIGRAPAWKEAWLNDSNIDIPAPAEPIVPQPRLE